MGGHGRQTGPSWDPAAQATRTARGPSRWRLRVQDLDRGTSSPGTPGTGHTLSWRPLARLHALCVRFSERVGSLLHEATSMSRLARPSELGCSTRKPYHLMQTNRRSARDPSRPVPRSLHTLVCQTALKQQARRPPLEKPSRPPLRFIFCVASCVRRAGLQRPIMDTYICSHLVTAVR